MTDEELLRYAAKAMETNNQAWKQLADSGDAGFWEAEEQPFYELSVKAITALRQALETEQEPVAWISDSPTKGNGKQLHWTKAEAFRWSSNITPLYTAPPKQWVGLTDEEIQDLSYISQKIDASNSEWFDRLEFARAIEQALKEKNKW